ncbi:MAG: CRISPR-associated protein [Porticoccaceae bacterium]|nr:MAG: CRISPR-associated protein [Porticoccaceae bacterium]
MLERQHPDRLVVLGTAGSMWDHLFEGDVDLGAEAEEERLALVEAVERQAVEQSLLDRLAPLLSRRLDCAVRLRVISYCRTPEEQVGLLRDLAEEIGPADRVELDITHGFRHLPLLALLAALHLRRVRGAQVSHIWYGAFDPDTRQAPVYDLAGLLGIADWLEALSVYGRTRDYGVFHKLLGEEIGALLRQAAFFEMVNRLGQARSKLREVLGLLSERSEDPVFELFRGELERRLGWAKQDNFYLRQRELALEYLACGRYLEAILTAWEAFITRLQRESGERLDPDNMEHRERIRQAFEDRERERSPRSELYRDYDRLRRLRNAVAHGSQPKGEEVLRALSGPEQMHAFLEELFARLLPAELG